MKKFFAKSLAIATILILSVNGCIRENNLPDTLVVIVEHTGTGVQAYSQHIVESSGVRGWQYFWNGDYDSSLEMFYLTLAMIELQELSQITDYYNRIGQLHSRLGNSEQAEYYFSKALEIAQINDDISARLRALRNFVALHASRGDMEQFEETMDIKAAIRDSLRMALYQEQQMLHEVEQKARAIQQARTNIIFLSIILALAIALSVAGFFIYRRKMRSIMIAVQQNEALIKYKKEAKQTGLGQEKVDASEKLAFDIQQLFETEKIYRQKGLSTDDVAKRLNIGSRQLTGVISQYYGKNFAKYVNTFRVEDAIEMLKEQGEGGKYAHYTVLGIGEEVGFSGRNAFYSAFKQITGVAPLEYMKALNSATKNGTESSE